MLFPRFRIKQSVISVTAALLHLGYITNTVIPAMLSFLRKLTGQSPDVSHIPETKVLDVLEKKITKVLADKIKSALPETGASETEGDTYLHIEASEKHRYTPDGWEMVVKVEMGYYYVLFLKPFHDLKNTNRPVYTIVRDLLSIVIYSGHCPCVGLPEIYDWLGLPDYVENEENFEDEEEMKEAQKRLRSDENVYNRYFRKTAPEKRAKVLKQAHKRIKKISGDTPPGMIEILKDLLKLACLCCVEVNLKTIDQEMATDYSYEFNSIYNAFALLWDQDDEWSEHFFQYMDDQWGNYGPATTFFKVTDGTDMDHILITLRIFTLLQKVWYSICDLVTTLGEEKTNGNIS